MERQLAMKPLYSPIAKSCRSSARRLRGLRSFTLVELMVVMGIIAILIGVSVPAITSVVQNNNINRAGQQVADQINLARQMASAKNLTVELRIFQMPGATGYTELQLGTNSSTGLWVPVNRVTILPQNIVISTSTALSTAFSTYSALTMTNSGMTSNALYHPYEFRPSGIITPVLSMNNYCLAIVPSRSASVTSLSSIKNYAIVQINPVTSTPLVYRP